MKFTCYTQDIRDALKFAVKCAATKPIIQILSAVKLTADDGKLTLETTDNTSAAQVAIPVNAEETGSAAVDAKFLFNVICKLDGDTITFDDASGMLGIQSEGAHFNLNTFNADDYPKTNFDCPVAVNVRSTVLKNLIRQSVFAASKSLDRPLFQSVNLRTEGTDYEMFLTATATNAERLSFNKTPIGNDQHGAIFDANIPAATLKILATELPADVEDFVTLCTDERCVVAKINNIMFKTRLLEGEFPDIMRLLEIERPVVAKVKTAELKAALNRINLISRDSEYKAVKFCLAGNILRVCATDNNHGSAEEFIETVTDEDHDLTIAFAIHYLLDFLNATDDAEIEMRFKSNIDSAQFVGVSNPFNTYIVTPVRA